MREIFKPDEFYFVPLGGSEEFGCNLNLYVCDDEYLAIDCGIGFADERMPGIDLLLPDPWLIEEARDKLKGMVITHAHEDHFGAVAYLWDRFECPIYATKFTAAVLRKKFEQEGVDNAKITIIEPGKTFKAGSYEIVPVPVSHSVPDSCSLVIKTRHGHVLHSGDWNLDPAPIIGSKTEESAFRAIGDEGILAYVGDSTNSQVDGYSGKEEDVAKGMAAEFKDCKGMIAVTIFASNIGRLISILRAAQETGRSVALLGRSLHRMVGCAIDCGYMKDLPAFVTEDEIAHIPRENLVLVVTGSQGEHRAALARISRGDHRSVSLGKGDTVIFSSRAIPGNERKINTVKNNFSAAGVKIITPRDTKHIIHVSGHPCKEEILSMLQWTRPQCVIPVHGERLQLDAQAKLAASCQVQDVIVPNNGSVIRLAPARPAIVDHVETALLAVDQRRIIPATHQSITARRKLQYSGTVHASLVLDKKMKLLGDIKVDTVGLTCERHDDCILTDLKRYIKDILPEVIAETNHNEDDIAEAVRIPLRRYVSDMLGLTPKTTVHVTLINI